MTRYRIILLTALFTPFVALPSELPAVDRETEVKPVDALPEIEGLPNPRNLSENAYSWSAPKSSPADNSLGYFNSHSDVGPVKHPGAVSYDAQAGTYIVSGSGTNMWFGKDEFHFVWRKLDGNFILSAESELLGEGVDPHRKIGWMVRPDLNDDSPYVDVALHGDGLTSMQYRRTRGGDTEQMAHIHRWSQRQL